MKGARGGVACEAVIQVFFSRALGRQSVLWRFMYDGFVIDFGSYI